MGTFNGQLWMQVHGCAALISLPLRLPLIVSLDLSRYRSPQHTNSIYVIMTMVMWWWWWSKLILSERVLKWGGGSRGQMDKIHTFSLQFISVPELTLWWESLSVDLQDVVFYYEDEMGEEGGGGQMPHICIFAGYWIPSEWFLHGCGCQHFQSPFDREI